MRRGPGAARRGRPSSCGAAACRPGSGAGARARRAERIVRSCRGSSAVLVLGGELALGRDRGVDAGGRREAEVVAEPERREDQVPELLLELGPRLVAPGILVRAASDATNVAKRDDRPDDDLVEVLDLRGAPDAPGLLEKGLDSDLLDLVHRPTRLRGRNLRKGDRQSSEALPILDGEVAAWTPKNASS